MDTHTFKDRLEIEKNQLFADLSTQATYNAHSGEWEMRLDNDNILDADRNDIGDANEAADEHIATLALLETRYRNVLRALQKIESGTYGICEIAAEPIELARLEANPAARTCIAHLDEEDLLPL